MPSLRRSNWLARRLVSTTVLPSERAVARNKLVTNAALGDLLGARTPALLSVFNDNRELLPRWLATLPSPFVVKSAISSVGRHVCVLRRVDDGHYAEPDGLVWPLPELKLRLQRMPRPVFAEAVVEAHPALATLAKHGTLCDLRLHFIGDELVVGRCRIPTARSRGYGNVGRGALGVCFHPDGRLDVNHPYARAHAEPELDGHRIDGFQMLEWPRVRAEAARVAALFGSPHVGVDGTIAPDGHFVFIEVTLVPDTKWLGPIGTLAFRDALRRARPKAGRVEDWIATRPDLWRWVSRRADRVEIVLDPAPPEDAPTDAVADTVAGTVAGTVAFVGGRA